MQGIWLIRLSIGIIGEPIGNAALNLRVPWAMELVSYVLIGAREQSEKGPIG